MADFDTSTVGMFAAVGLGYVDNGAVSLVDWRSTDFRGVAAL